MANPKRPRRQYTDGQAEQEAAPFAKPSARVLGRLVEDLSHAQGAARACPQRPDSFFNQYSSNAIVSTSSTYYARSGTSPCNACYPVSRTPGAGSLAGTISRASDASRSARAIIVYCSVCNKRRARSLRSSRSGFLSSRLPVPLILIQFSVYDHTTAMAPKSLTATKSGSPPSKNKSFVVTSVTPKSERSSAYNLNFEQHLKDRGIYPVHHDYAEFPRFHNQNPDRVRGYGNAKGHSDTHW